jgi:voltage-gated potassium channel
VSVPVLVPVGLTVIDYGAWALFGIDYVIRISIADPRGRYFLRNIADLVILALPALRPLRLLRLLILLKMLNRRASDSLRGRVAIYAGASAIVVVFCASLAILDAERGHRGSNINSFADALWWAATTVVTVGYGDRYPVTAEGRLIAVALMLAGIALLGVITASIATWLIEAVRDAEAEGAATRSDIHSLRAEIAQLKALIAAAQPDSSHLSGSPGVPPGATAGPPPPVATPRASSDSGHTR